MITGCLLVAAAASAVSAAQPPPAPPPAPAPAVQQAPADSQESARRIGAAEARQALAKGEAVLVDVRPKEAYDAEHAKGAIVIPLGEVTARAGELPKDKLIITYCT
jgi:3-mercaptopyruvate sulfurtransferase SseA